MTIVWNWKFAIENKLKCLKTNDFFVLNNEFEFFDRNRSRDDDCMQN